MRSVHTYAHGGAVYRVELEPQPGGEWQVTINGRAFSARAAPLAEGGWLLTLDGGQTLVYAARRGETRHVWAGGEAFALTPAEASAARRRGVSAGAGDLTAQMPGQVVAVLAETGEAVQCGQTLVVLEAMKMEIRVSAPADGVVTRLLVRPGDVVERGQRLVEIAAPEAADG
ncbi:MAG: biotin/lipoyl-containing protein [Aggregatilineales bacterium]